MKKLALALVCMFSVAFFASCTKTIEHPEPTIAILAGDNFITGTVDQPTVIDANDENVYNLKYGFHVEYNSETQKELASLIVTLEWTDEDGVHNDYDTIDLTGKTSYDYSEYLFEDEDRDIITFMEGTIKAVVTDADNQSSNATIAFKVQYEEEELPIYELEWVRNGTQVEDATEAQMEALGLKWTGTYKEDFATIEPLNTNVILYLCDGDDFDDIVYWSDVTAYFSDLAETVVPIQKYRKISAWASHDYNDMLAVVNGDELNLIRINHAEIQSQTSGSTKITISCELK